jgi:hypothetical protein
LNRLVDFHEIWYGVNVIQGDLEAIFWSHSLNHFKITEVQYYEVSVAKIVGLNFLGSMVTIATKLFTAVNSVKLS